MFVYVYSASVLPGMVPWFVILISQLRFRQAHKKAIEPSVPLHSVPVCELFDDGVPDLRISGMYFNEDTRMSLFVGMIFPAAVQLHISFLVRSPCHHA